MSRVEIGVVARAHGIRGEVVVALHDPESTALDVASELWLDGTAYAIEGVRGGNHGPLVALAGVVDRTTAETLRGRRVEVDRAVVATDDDVLLGDLIGFEVRTSDGARWGVVVAIEIGAQDRLVIEDDTVERLLPVVDELIAEIDVDARVIVATPPEGWPATAKQRLE